MNARSRTHLLSFQLPWFIFVGSMLLAVIIGASTAVLDGISRLVIPGALIAIATALISVRYERLPFYLLVATLPLVYILNSESMPTSFLVVPGAMAILAWLQQVAFRRTTVLVDRRSTALAVLLGTLATLSAIRAGTADALGGARAYWLVIVLFFITQNVLLEEAHFVTLGWVIAISLGLLGAITLFEQARLYLLAGGSASAAQLHDNRLAVNNINGIGMWLTVGLPFALQLGCGGVQLYRAHRYVLGLCAAFMVLGIVSTLSLTAHLGLAVSLMLVFLYSQNRSRRLGLVFLGAVTVGMVLVSPLMERLDYQLWLVQEQDPIYWGTKRGLAWYTGLQAIRQAPLLGHGPGPEGVTAAVLPYLPLDFLKRIVSAERVVFIPHNAFLSVGAEIGLPGALLFLTLLASVIIPLWHQALPGPARAGNARMLYMGQAILIGLIPVLVQNMALSEHLNKYLWLLLGAGLAFIRISKSSGKERISYEHTTLSGTPSGLDTA
jgi:hypothetical protein